MGINLEEGTVVCGVYRYRGKRYPVVCDTQVLERDDNPDWIKECAAIQSGARYPLAIVTHKGTYYLKDRVVYSPVKYDQSVLEDVVLGAYFADGFAIADADILIIQGDSVFVRPFKLPTVVKSENKALNSRRIHCALDGVPYLGD